MGDRPKPRDAGSGWEPMWKDMGKDVDWAWEEEGRPRTERGRLRGRLPSSGKPWARPMEPPMMD